MSNSLLEILKEKSEHTVEDKTVILSLVPVFKELNDHKNKCAKMEMKGVMRTAKNMAFHLQHAKCVTALTCFLNVPSTYENNFQKQNCQQFCKFQITELYIL